MRTPREVVKKRREQSELATLSRDPALTCRPDPGFHAKFRNPDEIIEGDFDAIQSLARPYVAAAQTWIGLPSWRRSPKD